MRWAILVLVLLSGPFLSSPVEAILIDHGNTTIDTDAGLEWLDLTMSLGRSYNDLVGKDGSNEFGAGGSFPSWRYATIDEVFELFVHAGIPFINVGSGDVENIAPVMALEELVGVTFPGDAPASSGITSTPIGMLSVRQVGLIQILNGGGSAVANTLNFAIADSDTSAFVGSWLVRSSAIPEPASLVLLAAGLAGVVLIRWRQTH